MTEQDAYDELCCYTLTHGDPEFIHQHVVDAYMAQHADADTKPIGITFALVGLYLHNERQFSGRAVQLAHMRLARNKQQWPAVILPRSRGSITAAGVLAVPPGAGRDLAIHAWCADVWQAYRVNESTIAKLLRDHGI